MATDEPRNLRLASIDLALDEAATVRAADAQRNGAEPVSVVVPCFGQLECTRLLVPTLLRYNRKPSELIFVDVESLDGTSEYLAGLHAGAAVRVEVVRV